MLTRQIYTVLTMYLLVYYGVPVAAQEDGHRRIAQGAYSVEAPVSIQSEHHLLEALLLDYKIDSAQQVLDNMVGRVDTSESAIRAWYHYHRGDLYSYQEDYPMSDSLYMIAIRTSLELSRPNVKILYRAYNNLNYNADTRGQTDKALQYLIEAYKYIQYDSTNLRDRSNILYNLANSLYQLKDHELAGRYMEEALSIDYKTQDSTSISYDLKLIGDIYNRQSRSDDALIKYREALDYTPQHLGDIRTNIMTSISTIYNSLNQPDSAYYWAQRSIDLSRMSEGVQSNLVTALIEKSKACAQLQDDLCVKVSLSESKILAQSLGLYNSEFDIGYLQMISAPLNSQKQIWQQLLRYATEHHLSTRELRLYRWMNESEHVGLFATHEQNVHLRRYNDLLRSQSKADLSNETSRLEARMSLIQREQEAEYNSLQMEMIQQQLTSSQKLRWLLLAMICMVVSGASMIIYTLLQKRKIERERHTNQISSQVKEIDTLRSRINDVLEQKDHQKLTLPTKEVINDMVDTPLTDKEYEILIDVAAGMTNKEIAASQYISQNTVKFHMKNIFSKLDINNRKDVIKRIMSDTRR